MTAVESIRREIKKILVRVMGLSVEPEEIGNDDLLFEGRLGLDSVTTIEILTEMEEIFGFEFSDEEIAPELFQSVNSLALSAAAHTGTQRD